MLRISVLNSPSNPLQVSIHNQTLKLYENFALQKHLDDNVEKLCEVPQLIRKVEKNVNIFFFLLISLGKHEMSFYLSSF